MKSLTSQPATKCRAVVSMALAAVGAAAAPTWLRFLLNGALLKGGLTWGLIGGVVHSQAVHAQPLAVQVAAPSATPAAPAQTRFSKSLPSTNVAWLPAASDAEVDQALAQARSERKPVLLYWGASWCPPCNQLKATFFNRQDFAELSKSFVAVHVDGDRPGAQVLGRRFKVSGYPTVVVFNSGGAEITRLPGEVDAPRMMAVLQLGLAGGRPVKAVLADALTGKPLQTAEWRLLSFYSWETDEQQLVPKAELAGTLWRLSVASPSPEADYSTRLWLKALGAGHNDQALKADAAARDRLQRVLSDVATARQQLDVLVHQAADIVRTLHPDAGPARAALVQRYDEALQRLQADASLSRGDRLVTVLARVELARLEVPKDETAPKLAQRLVAEVREQVARLDRDITDGYERQAVITAAAHTLGRAGLWLDSETLLKANLSKSHAPYYLMSQLGSDARKQGRNAEALSWYRQAFESSEGPATRLQWGTGYLHALVDLAPLDAVAIEKTASQLLTEAAKDSGAFAARSGRSLLRASQKVLAWADQAPRTAVLARLRSQSQALCPKVDAAAGQRAACEALFKPAAPGGAAAT
jgi:thioredoxin-like negative regulator of GroEL